MLQACRILPHERASGAANMALDEALLDAVGADPSAAVLRTYEWSEPTLTLGYFQPKALATSDPRWRDVPIVRRATGGGAIWHHNEVTYALILPVTHPLARRAGDLYRAVHRGITDALRSQGVLAERRGETAPAGPRPLLCFQDRDTEDLVVGVSKVVGSAQRRRSGSVLQHGSLLLARSPRTPELFGISDLAPVTADPTFWAGLLRGYIAEQLRILAVTGEVSDAERRRARELELEVYLRPAWNDRR